VTQVQQSMSANAHSYSVYFLWVRPVPRVIHKEINIKKVVKYFGVLLFGAILSGCLSETQTANKWEYKRVRIDPLNRKSPLHQLDLASVDADELITLYHKKLNDLGAEGWELIYVTEGEVHFFKRPLE
ncbi:hypothetical protein ACNKU7_18605, partial [Microbulbifer sp. SA54]|uniref:hypothetical protein n=1 Tax=Microbulbifer sp. SA54 TaxID=3401577 RepID=UPI003AACA253